MLDLALGNFHFPVGESRGELDLQAARQEMKQLSGLLLCSSILPCAVDEFLGEFTGALSLPTAIASGAASAHPLCF